MAIPSFQDFMLPMLKLFSDSKEHKMLEVKEELTRYFNISEEEKKYFYRAENKKYIKIE